MGKARLTAKGQQVRALLAAAGVELTPDQLTSALEAAARQVDLRCPGGNAPQRVWLEELQEAINQRATSAEVRS